MCVCLTKEEKNGFLLLLYTYILHMPVQIYQIQCAAKSRDLSRLFTFSCFCCCSRLSWSCQVEPMSSSVAADENKIHDHTWPCKRQENVIALGAMKNPWKNREGCHLRRLHTFAGGLNTADSGDTPGLNYQLESHLEFQRSSTSSKCDNVATRRNLIDRHFLHIRNVWLARLNEAN